MAVGDYYCNSTTGQAYVVSAANLAAAKAEGITPIAAVISLNPSQNDKNHGWKHGYGISLKAVFDNKAWAVEEKLYQSSSHRFTLPEDGFKDVDGYEGTHYITDNNVYSAATHPAFFAAINFDVPAPTTSSGWYLPAPGQTYQMLLACGTGDYTTASYKNEAGDYGWQNNTYAQAFYRNMGTFLSSAGEGYYTAWPEDRTVRTWTCVEKNEAKSIGFETYGAQIWFWNADDSKTLSNTFYTRPFISF